MMIIKRVLCKYSDHWNTTRYKSPIRVKRHWRERRMTCARRGKRVGRGARGDALITKSQGFYSVNRSFLQAFNNRHLQAVREQCFLPSRVSILCVFVCACVLKSTWIIVHTHE